MGMGLEHGAIVSLLPEQGDDFVRGALFGYLIGCLVASKCWFQLGDGVCCPHRMWFCCNL